MKKRVCPIGLECVEHPNFQGCPNYQDCLSQTYSWAIPYRYENQTLIVDRFPYRYFWYKEARGISDKMPAQCVFPSGSYVPIDHPRWQSEEMAIRIREEWTKAGWIPAIEIPNNNKELS